MCVSTNKGTNWNAPFLVVGSQSAWPSTGAAYEEGARITYPRNFQEYGGKIYIIASIDGTHGVTFASLTNLGLALVACEINASGTVGSLFRISTPAYSPPSGTISYDATLGPPLLAYSQVFGTHGGSGPSQPAVEWATWATENSISYVEPGTFYLDSEHLRLFRFWRRITTPDSRVYNSKSFDGGNSWTAILKTNIPDSPGVTTGVLLSDGRIAVVGNPVDGATVRDPLYLAIFSHDGTTNLVTAIRQGVTGTPTYAGTFKGGGASYPDAVQVGNYLYVGYSLQKETMGFSRVVIPGLADNNNDL